jgi:hypothetical protein
MSTETYIKIRGNFKVLTQGAGEELALYKITKMKNKIISKGSANHLYGELCEKGDAAVRAANEFLNYGVTFSMKWYRENATNAKQLERYFADRLHDLMEQTGTTDLTDDGRIRIEGSRREFAGRYEAAESLLKHTRQTFDDERYQWKDTPNGITFDKDYLRKYADSVNTFAIDSEAAGEYYSILKEMKAVQAKMLAFEQEHKIVTLADDKSAVMYSPSEYGGIMNRLFSLKFLLDWDLTPELFEEVFINEFKK